MQVVIVIVIHSRCNQVIVAWLLNNEASWVDAIDCGSQLAGNGTGFMIHLRTWLRLVV